jgi:hypothetical protein
VISPKKNIIKVELILLILFLFNISLFGQLTPQISIPFEIYDDAGGQKILYFGLDQTATDAIDFHLGESDLPPYPPTGAFDARWILPQNGFNGSLSSWSDFRFASGFPFSGNLEHRFHYQCAEGATAMFFRWNLQPEITGLIQDLINGSIVSVPISGNGTYQLNDFTTINQLRLLVYYNNIVSSVENVDKNSQTYVLEQNYPNPFNPSTKISWQIPVSSWQTLKIFDILGNEVATLVDEYRSAGRYEVEFDAKHLTGGVYFYQLISASFSQTNKMVILK